MIFLIILFTIIHISTANIEAQHRAANVCYEGYGCFTTAYPFWDLFVRPLTLLPQSPDKIATQFYLYTRKNANNGVKITPQSVNDLFGSNRKTRFIIHGFLHNGFKQWVIDMKDSILRVEDSNVIAVDWSKGNGFPYTQATANTQIVGAEIAILVNSYINKGLISSDSVHIIGHSLGSHIAGYAGERVSPKIGRITGLDPAGPYFENSDTRVRLDPTDAKFVDVIHSDGASTLQLGLGLMQNVGHVDFYPNGGKDQPNCPKTSSKLLGAIFGLVTLDIDGIEDSVACSHMTAVHFYTSSIEKESCSFSTYPCSSLNDFKSAKCLSCSVKGCNHMGHWASENNDQGSLYFTTQDATRAPYCYNHYKLRAVSNTLSSQGKTKGRFTVVLKGTQGSSVSYVIDNADTSLTAGSAIESLGEASNDIGIIQSASLSFTKASCLLSCFGLDDKWSIKNLVVTDGQTQKLIKLCPSQDFISSGSSVIFNLC
jgi:pimeloyl-ACP methyl ester carboxylesterase